jgi:hypothetical protein
VSTVGSRTAAKTTPDRALAPGADDARCGGPLTFGKVVACPKIEGGARHVYTVTTTVDGERLSARVPLSRSFLHVELTGPDGTKLCAVFPDPTTCVAPKAGTYTLTVTNPGSSTDGGAAATVDYLLSVDSRTNPSACVDLSAADFAFGAPRRDDTLPAGSVGRCYQFDQPAGAVVRIRVDRNDKGLELQNEVENAAGKPVCSTRTTRMCVLSGRGPYRLFVADYDGGATAYHLAMTRMSNPDGCRAMPLTPFGGPGDRTGSGTLVGVRSACLTFPASAGPHLFVAGKGADLFWQLFDRAGKEVTCSPERYGRQCALPADGTYTLAVQDVGRTGERHDFEAAMYPLAGTEGCAPGVGTAWGSPPVQVTMRSAMQVDCHFLDAEPGDRVRVSSAAEGWVTNGSGARVCRFHQADCVLSGAGPYRIISIGDWNERTNSGSYTVDAVMLRDARGCVPVAPGRYGDDPAGASTTDPCRLLIVPTPGRYRIELVDDKNKRGAGTVVDGAGARVCDTGWCTFPAAGRYKLMADGTRSQATVFLPESGGPATGCVPASDDPTAAAHDLHLRAGQYDCLVLPTPAGAGLMLSHPRGASTGNALNLSVQDATGKPACDLRQLTDHTCILQGTAPFRAVASQATDAVDRTGYYPLTFVRAGGTPACPVLPAGSFAAPASVDVTFDIDHYVRCFSVPASEHTTAEIISVQNTSGLGKAQVVVVGDDGKQACRTTMSDAHFALCRLHPGPSTILVESSSPFGTYAVARRDVTGTATGCRQIGSTAVGAPSTTGTVTSPADVHCYQVPAETADRLVIGVRDAKSVSRTLVLDPTGADAGCTATATRCSVTGKAGYQVLVWGAVSRASTAAYQLDVWKVWTAGGPARECTTVPSTAYGFGPYTGTLSSAAPAVCLVATRRHDDDLSFALTDPVTPTGGFRAGLYAVTGAGMQACAAGAGGRHTCSPGGDGRTEQTAFLLSLGEQMSPQPYRWEATCGTPLCGDSSFTVTGVNPTAVVGGGTRSITIRGTSLHQRDTVRVTPAGRSPVTAIVQTVSADRTVMTVTVDLASAPAGPASVEVRSHAAGLQPVVLPDVLQVSAPVLRATKAPAITGRVVVAGTVTASTGEWTPPATSYTYQWAANGVAIRGATGRTYVISAGVLAKRLTVTVTAASAGATPGTATSAPSAAVGKGAAPKATTKPVIRGTAKVGRTVTATTGSWSPKPDAYRYEWRINGAVVRGAAGASLRLTAAMRDKRLTVTVIAVKAGHTDGKALSKAVTVRR